MSCYGCQCNFCIYNAELPVWYVTVGEIQNELEICFCCDECNHYDGDFKKKSQWKSKCDKMKLAQKYVDSERERKDRIARKKRASFKMIKKGE